MSTKNTVVIEKDGVRAVTSQSALKALEKRGWTAVDDGDKTENQAAQVKEN